MEYWNCLRRKYHNQGSRLIVLGLVFLRMLHRLSDGVFVLGGIKKDILRVGLVIVGENIQYRATKSVGHDLIFWHVADLSI
jgi:hypothetical protein